MAAAVPHLPRRRKRPWALSFFSLLAVGGLVSMPLLAGKPGGAELPDMVRFLGHFHPLLLHLPIGVFTLIVFQELGAIFARRGRTRGPESLFPMFFGAASAIVAVIAGFLLLQGDAGEYAGNALAERHMWGGLVFSVAAVLTFIVKAWTLALDANPAWFRLLLFASVGVMGFASHDGASITHGGDYLTKFAPAPLRRLLGLDASRPAAPAKPVADQVVYTDIVAPILERRCGSCHNESKAKGKFRMDSYDLLLKGGKNGAGIKPGDAEKSEIVVRMALPADDDDHMPPDGKTGLNAAELQVVKWWLAGGADPHKKVADGEVPAEIKEALAKLPGTGPASAAAHAGQPAKSASAGPDESLKKEVARLSNEFPGALAFESEGSPLVTFTAVSLRGKLDDGAFAKLGPVLPHLVTVDLSATRITDKSVAVLESAKQLRLVRLAETGITDAAIDSLLKLPALESVNFYGSKVTDHGVLKLAALPHLKRLYVWQTAVTPEAVKQLKAKLPDCEIIGGAVNPSPDLSQGK